MDSLMHTIHTWQHTALVWLSTRDPLSVDLVTLLAMTLEGMGIPGIPGEIAMLAQAGLIESGKHSYLHASVVGTVANFLGSLLGYQLAALWSDRFPERWRARLMEGATRLSASQQGGWLVLLSRSFGALRTPVTWGAGAGGFPYGAYLIWALLGAIVHVFVWQYMLWQGTGLLSRLKPRELVAVGILALIGGLIWWLRERAERNYRQLAPQQVSAHTDDPAGPPQS